MKNRQKSGLKQLQINDQLALVTHKFIERCELKQQQKE